MSTDKNQDMVDYVLAQLCEINNDAIKKLGVSLTLRKIIAANEEFWEGLIDRKIITGLDIQMIKHFKQWYIHMRNKGTIFPSELEDWKSLNTPETNLFTS